jgi:hypothetical protein
MFEEITTFNLVYTLCNVCVSSITQYPINTYRFYVFVSQLKIKS